MTGPAQDLERSRQELAAAELLADHGFTAAAVSRAYYAAFYAAEAALLALGETRSQQSGVVAAFGQLLVRDRRLDEQAGRLLRSLFERRSQADYELAEIPAEEVRAALIDARRVVDTVEAWLAQQPPGPSGQPK
ncbi:MAG: HEPN domain-containing protein [Acidimicrobiia bacterium]